MRLPWSRKEVDLEPTTGDNAAQEVTVVERKLGLGKVGTIFASGASLFSDGYANSAIGPAKLILKTYLYPEAFKGNNKSQLLSSMAFAGIIFGQLTFGYISDKIGRKFGMLACTMIVFVFSALQAGAKGAGGTPEALIDALIAYRFLVGVGIGGEYPTGSVAAAEGTEDPQISKKSQQKLFVLATNTMLDFAFTISYFVCLVCIWIFGEDHLRAVWRITLGVGIVPPLFLLWFRLRMKEPEAYARNSMQHTRIPYWLIIKRYWVKLLAVSITWFIYDWITYPFGIYASTITNEVIPNATLKQNVGWGCLINFFYVPGTLFGALIVDYLGPKYCMIFGLVMQAIFGFILSGTFTKLVPNHIAGFAILYGLFLSWGEVGPGNNLGLLASKAIGPTAARGQLYGIAAAIGKVGGFIGTYTFQNIINDFAEKKGTISVTGPFWIGSGLAIVSALITFFFIPNIRVDAMKDEDVEFREYLERNGFDTSK
ncbi:phospholipid transporter [Kockovaella imperatae]|uniref:Phospholipid transporter n=1 Tax=Kockovaella imperatae TaxID=4999 RepID=A0A1Y1UQ79_9TREE|nr:phospholipid transporter [Kockovaella imperatae]ORX40191.1 phospholipid transporter [Kockovaella imperatae]